MRAFCIVLLVLACRASAESLWLSDELSPREGQFVWAPVRVFTSFNPEFPLGGNDGPLWQGKGFNSSVSAGAGVAWGGFILEFRPEFDFSQDLSYRMLNGPGDYWDNIDRPQSYGVSPLTHADWGESELRYVWSGFRIAFGSKALVYGPAQRNHLLLSDNAGGFPHLDVGTDKPIQTNWGSFEGRMIWGALSDSALYDRFSWGGVSDWRFFHGLTLGYSPSFWPEMTLGAARIFYSPWATITPFKAFESVIDSFWKEDRGSLFSGGPNGDDDIDQMAAVYFDLAMPGFRVYGELGRNDHSSGLRDFLIQPDHSLGYVVGFRKEFALPGALWYVTYEQADLGLNYGSQVRPAAYWYRHYVNTAGYTLGGQVLGAEIGPGSNGDYAESGYSWSGNTVYLSWYRIANDVDYWFHVVHPTDYHSGDITFISSLGFASRWDNADYRVDVGLVDEFDRYWIAGNDQLTWRLSCGVTWNL